MTESTKEEASGAARPNANHIRRIASTFAHVDKLLREVERLARLDPSPFRQEQADVGATEGRLLLALVETARQRMLLMLDRLGVPRPRANLSARWSIVTTLRFVDIALSELTEKTLRGYGAIDADAAAEISTVASALRSVIDRGRELLQPQEAARLQARLATVPGPLGDVLRRAEEISTARGIVEVRALIRAAADRAEAKTIDVGVFGRVSSGKSSLLNAIIGADILPVGATPVTAVPLRVTSGELQVRVLFADGRDEVVEPERLARFATEASNPDNALNVRSILVQVPQLPQGLALLDTPGVGSMSQSGPAQAFAWLPRCDLGIVLVPAGAPLGRDELALIRGLSQSGIPIEILLSKSDLIADAERSVALEYLRRELTQNIGTPDASIRALSVAPAARELFDRWKEDELLPMIADRRRLAAQSFVSRIHAIIAALDAALQGQSDNATDALELQRIRLEAQEEIEATANELENAGRDAAARAADAVARAWKGGGDGHAAARSVLIETATDALGRARVAADHALLARGDDDAATDMGHRIPPLFDPPLLDTLPVPPAPGILNRIAPHASARRLIAPILPALDAAYSTYALRIRAWSLQRLEENFEQAVALNIPDSAGHSPELRPLVALVHTHFASPSQ